MYCNETTGSRSRTLEPEVRRAIDCAVKACSCGRLDFHRYKPRVVLFKERVLALACCSTSYALTGQAHALSWMQGPTTSDTNVMKQQGAGHVPSTFEPEVRRAIDCAAKACSCGRVDFRAYKPRVVTVLSTTRVSKYA